MEKTLFVRHAFLHRRPHRFRVVRMTLLLMLVLSGTALAQPIAITGTVTSAGGATLRGVTVRVVG
ncbi:MAG: hypothetical protein ACREOG_21255, partial [Gemmatimonadaceae bacterium]